MKVLVLSRNYPNDDTPLLGIWVAGLTRHVGASCEVKVVAPVPYCPPLPSSVRFTRFRRIAPRQVVDGIDVLRPRFLTGPGYSLHSFEATTTYWSILQSVDRLRAEFPFDVIHAHFTYPDGVVAARLGSRYGVPVVITEHALWHPWMDDYPRVRRQAVWAARSAAFHLPVSEACRRSIADFTGDSESLRVVHVGLDSSVFRRVASSPEPNPNQILYVGRIQRVKGVDVLLRAMRRLADRNPSLRLVIVGGSFYRGWQLEEDQIRALADDLKLGANVEFVGSRPPHEVAEYMRRSGVVVLPSRRESFGSVLAEALACGTPVVGTRCGGPESIVTDQVGRLVPIEDDQALAEAIEDVLRHRAEYPAERLSAFALERFSWDRIARQVVDLYAEAVARARGSRVGKESALPI